MKGIILAGGHGTRLYPLTLGLSKQMLPVYPLSMLMMTGIRDILVISTPGALPGFELLLKDGSQWGLTFSYAAQANPNGLAEAFLIKPDFLCGVRQSQPFRQAQPLRQEQPPNSSGGEPVCLILGDNIFYGHGLPSQLREAATLQEGALIFAYPVRDPQRYGVVEFDSSGRALSIEEKPEKPRSHYAVPGLYFYDGQVTEIASNLKPSGRGELEITDVNRVYLERQQLRVNVMGRGVAWLDAGTHESLLQAANFVQAVEERQGMMISCPEEIAYRMGYIDQVQVRKLAEQYRGNQYGSYLMHLADEVVPNGDARSLNGGA
jgi:glucose-1-phosphate thymidylyltransferase